MRLLKKNLIALRRGTMRRDILEDRWITLLATGQSYGWESEFPITQYADVELKEIGCRDARTLGEALQWYANDPDGAMVVRQVIDDELEVRLTGPRFWPIEEIQALCHYAEFLTRGSCEIDRN